ncbi:alpha/beta fold hydrolase [Rivihabitans pingtungensis]|uniref:Pimeloyl-ACP methyl ester carboxylesterase n=1 Tax=Rivihabitans pingtungensis TaxID=1054498 RepID=A0A318KM52_9NEIS|nr:alpha/beta hydrolase [Rivihabitans pingtungensis]PXX78861.1 pimeloyl-ACP methyl ester carboxylesterase [Rivihabitans pingtungensis]
MNDADFPLVVADDVWLNGPYGPLFVRRWRNSAESALAPMVLLHDSLGCVELWRDFPARLCAATGRDVIAYDRPGFGRSAARQDPLALDFIEAEAREVFPWLQEQLVLTDFIALGHSVGGSMAVHFAAGSVACQAVITIAAQACIEPRILQGIRQARQQFQDPQQFARLQKYHGDKAEWVLNAWIDTWLNPDFADWSLAATLPRVACPLLAIHGEHDEYGSEQQPNMLVALSGGQAQREIMAKTGHVPHRESPSQLVQRVADFVLVC